jgi:hypothetical protein
VRERRDHDGGGESVREREAQNAEARLGLRAQVLVGANGACAGKNDCKCSDKLSGELLGKAVQESLRRCSGAD